MAQAKRHEISDSDWERIRQYFPERNEHTMGRPAKDSRTMLNGMLWILGTGAAWRDLPDRYGAWQTVYKRFVQWRREGLFEKVFRELSADADMETLSIDGTYIKAQKASAGAERGELPTQNAENAAKMVHNQCIGVSRGSRSTMIHAVVDSLGNPVRVFLTSGEVCDAKAAQTVLESINITSSTVLADKAYGAAKLRQYIADFVLVIIENQMMPGYIYCYFNVSYRV